MRRLAVLALAPLMATGLAVPAHADTPPPTQTAFTVADTDGDGNYGLYQDASPAGTARVVVPESKDHTVYEVSGSRDGSRIVTVEDDLSARAVTSQVVVRDVSGQVVRVVSSTVQRYPDLGDPRAASDFSYDEAARLSPDGTRVVWTHVHEGSRATDVGLRTAGVAAGDPTTIPGTRGLVLTSFLDASTLAATSSTDSSVVTFPATGISGSSPSHPVVNAPKDTADFVVSPDGSRVAFRVDRAPTGDLTRIDVLVAPLSLSNGVATLGPATALTRSLENETPVWLSPTVIDFVRNDGNGGNGDVFTVPADGSSDATVVRATQADETSIAVGTQDHAAPAAAKADVPFALRGTAATIAWTAPPATPDLSGYRVTRTPDGGAPLALPFVPAPLTRVEDRGLVLGTTYSYAITAVDRSGNTSATVTRKLTALGVGAGVASPTSATTTTAPFPVTFGAGDPASTAFTVDYSVNGGAYTTWVDHTAAGVARTFGSPAATGVAATTSTLGSTYRFRVTAFDAFGNSTPRLESQPAVVPYDETKAKYSRGYGTARYGDAWYHSVRVLGAAGGVAVVTLPGHRFQLIATRCPSCGVVDVLYGGRVLATVDTYAKKRLPRQVLATVTWTSNANRTVTVRSRGTRGRPHVYVDGFALWR